MTMPPLVSVIGPVEPELLTAFVKHYRGLGIDSFFLGFHFPEVTSAEKRSTLLDVCHELVGRPMVVSDGAWHETLHAEIRDRLRQMAPAGWHLIADSDEFQAYPLPIPDIIKNAETVSSDTVGGLLLDRVSASGEITPWDPESGLDRSYPLGGFLTGLMLYGDPRKVVLAKSTVELTLGSHFSFKSAPTNELLVPVHHFKWRAGVLNDLNRRVIMHTSGAWHEVTPDVREEASRLLTHVTLNQGHIDVNADDPWFRPVTLTALPPWWGHESMRALADWQTRYFTTTGQVDAFSRADHLRRIKESRK
jgi:hypothetical protein